jgi:hypothetical protein
MRQLSGARALVVSIAVLLTAVSCGKDATTIVSPPALGEVVPEFSLTDVNPSSQTSQQAVSPRDYMQQVSAWYFGHAT